MIKYLEFCVNDLHNRDQAIHNYLLSLYAKLQPRKLMGYLEDQDKVRITTHAMRVQEGHFVKILLPLLKHYLF